VLSVIVLAAVAGLYRACSGREAATAVSEAPWTAVPGRIEAVDILLPVPEGRLTDAECNWPDRPWQLPGYTPSSFHELLGASGLDERDAGALASKATCGTDGCVVSPDLDLLARLRPASRATLYAAVGRFTTNVFQAYHNWRRSSLRSWSAEPGLPDRVRSVLDQLTYTEGDRLLIADQLVLCSLLHDDADRLRALQAVMTRDTLSVRVRLDPGADLDAVARYWEWGGPPRGVREALAGAPRDGGVAHVAVADLLPPFARARLDAYPARDAPAYDCFWTAAHFFDAAEPGGPLVYARDLEQILATSYVPVPFEERRLGDVILFRKANGTTAHAASYVAGDIVFTKNGNSHLVPWRLLHLADVEWRYHDAPYRAVYRQRRLVVDGSSSPR